MIYLKIFYSIRLSHGNIATKNVYESHILLDPFGGCRKVCSQNVGQLEAQVFYKGPLMIDDLLRTSPI